MAKSKGKAPTMKPGAVTPAGPGRDDVTPPPTEAELEALRLKLVATVAAGAHEVHRAYISVLGNHAEASWGACNIAARESFKEAAALVVDGMVDPEKLHDAWVAYRRKRGWKRGELNAEKKTHPFIAPWAEIPAWQQTKSILIVAAMVGILDALHAQEFEPAEVARPMATPKLMEHFRAQRGRLAGRRLR